VGAPGAVQMARASRGLRARIDGVAGLHWKAMPGAAAKMNELVSRTTTTTTSNKSNWVWPLPTELASWKLAAVRAYSAASTLQPACVLCWREFPRKPVVEGIVGGWQRQDDVPRHVFTDVCAACRAHHKLELCGSSWREMFDQAACAANPSNSYSQGVHTLYGTRFVTCDVIFVERAVVQATRQFKTTNVRDPRVAASVCRRTCMLPGRLLPSAQLIHRFRLTKSLPLCWMQSTLLEVLRAAHDNVALASDDTKPKLSLRRRPRADDKGNETASKRPLLMA